MNVQQALYLEPIFFCFEVNSAPCCACINARFLGFVAHISSFPFGHCDIQCEQLQQDVCLPLCLLHIDCHIFTLPMSLGISCWSHMGHQGMPL